MNAEAIVVVAGTVSILVQLVKWGGLPDKWGIYAVALLALVGVVLWAYSQEVLPGRTALYEYFAGWVAVTSGSAGFFGFVRAVAPSEPTRLRRPPAGAGQEPTVKVQHDHTDDRI